jgi:hypothetical protein
MWFYLRLVLKRDVHCAVFQQNAHQFNKTHCVDMFCAEFREKRGTSMIKFIFYPSKARLSLRRFLQKSCLVDKFW